MSILAILLAFVADPCRSLALVYADPDRGSLCPVDQAGPLFPWEVPPEGQRPHL